MSQVIKKRKIVLVSVLKPVDETRMFHKIGKSLAISGHFEVTIMGFPSPQIPIFPGITFIPSSFFHRLSFRRLLQPALWWQQIKAISPEIVIITTHELLWMGIFLRVFKGTKIIYDIQENYAQNIRHLSTFPAYVRWPLSGWVRLKERVTAHYIALFVLAERCYFHQLVFTQKKSIVVENKVNLETYSPLPSKKPGNTLIFTGTLSESTGIFTAIKLAQLWHQKDPRVKFLIAGYCPQSKTYAKILNVIRECPFITLVGGNQLVSHQTIVDIIQQGDIGIVAYPPNRATQDRIPTKVYEYLAAQLPIWLIDNTAWAKICAPYPAAITFPKSFTNLEEAQFERFQSTRFYQSIPGAEISWDAEVQKLTKILDSL